jgi:hypothetical protein
MMTQDETLYTLSRLAGEVRSLRYEVDQLRDELGEVRSQLAEERATRRETCGELGAMLEELRQVTA